MAARTLLQQAVPTTFGLKAAGWLVAVLEARRRLEAVRDERLAAQLGGAPGTLAALGDRALEISALYARELDLAEPITPLAHEPPARVAELGSALAGAAGAAAKIGGDLVLLAQTEVGEVAESTAGASSTMPQKRNPVRHTRRGRARCSRERSCRCPGRRRSCTSTSGRRARGTPSGRRSSGALAFAGGSVAAAADAVAELEVDAGRMRANLEASAGHVVAERVAFALTPRLGRGAAHEVVARPPARRRSATRSWATSACGLSAGDLDELLDPTGYLGAAEALVDRALAEVEREAG